MDGMKWCAGPCGRELPRSSYYLNGNGNAGSECKACHRVSERGRYRVRSRRPGFLKRRRDYDRDKYQSDPYYAEHRRQKAREFYWRKKLGRVVAA